MSVSNISEKTGEQIFMKISGLVGYGTRNNLEHYDDAAFNSQDPGAIFLFSGSICDSNIMEKRINGFSSNCQDLSGMTQQNI